MMMAVVMVVINMMAMVMTIYDGDYGDDDGCGDGGDNIR